MNPIGIGQHSYGESWRRNSGAPFDNALTFLEYAHSIGAAGVQVAILPDEQPNAAKIRARAEELGVFFEGNLNLPKTDGDLTAFENSVKAAIAAGATVARTACLGGRRYETFKTRPEYLTFKNAAIQWLTRAEPVLKKHKLKLGFENHKDWLYEEQIEIVRKLSSEWVGVCADFGNNIAFLQNPYEVIKALAPFAVTTHIKDMGVHEYADGFLLSEMPLDVGFLDIPRMVEIVKKANPKIHFNLEMMTRDPLKIPCLTESYYATFENRRASDLAATLATVKANSCDSLIHVTGLSPAERVKLEDENVRKSLRWAATHLPA